MDIQAGGERVEMGSGGSLVADLGLVVPILYETHHPLSLFDEVWRLENIDKDEAFHKRLRRENINTVKDFLTLLFRDRPRLQNILGRDMSAQMWEVTVEHARTCENLWRKNIVSYWERKTALMTAGGYWTTKNALMKGGERFELLEEEERFYDTWEFLKEEEGHFELLGEEERFDEEH